MHNATAKIRISIMTSLLKISSVSLSGAKKHPVDIPQLQYAINEHTIHMIRLIKKDIRTFENDLYFILTQITLK